MSQELILQPSSQTLETRVRAFRVARAFSKLGRELQIAFGEEQKRGRLSRAKIAKKLGIHRSQVSRWLSGSENLTLKTMAELAWAMGRELDLSFPVKAPVRQAEAVTAPTWAVKITFHANILSPVPSAIGRSDIINMTQVATSSGGNYWSLGGPQMPRQRMLGMMFPIADVADKENLLERVVV